MEKESNINLLLNELSEKESNLTLKNNAFLIEKNSFYK